MPCHSHIQFFESQSQVGNMKFFLLTVALFAASAAAASLKVKRDILPGDSRYGTPYHLQHHHAHSEEAFTNYLPPVVRHVENDGFVPPSTSYGVPFKTLSAPVHPIGDHHVHVPALPSVPLPHKVYGAPEQYYPIAPSLPTPISVPQKISPDLHPIVPLPIQKHETHGYEYQSTQGYLAPSPQSQSTYIQPQPTYVQPQITYGQPEPTYVQPQPTYVQPSFPQQQYGTPQFSPVQRQAEHFQHYAPSLPSPVQHHVPQQYNGSPQIQHEKLVFDHPVKSIEVAHETTSEVVNAVDNVSVDAAVKTGPVQATGSNGGYVY